jgi:hypothetical protein
MALTIDAAPSVGVEARVCVVLDAGGAGATLHAITRPGLPGQHDASVAATDKAGCAAWTPDAPGVVLLRAGEEELLVNVAGRAPLDLGVAVLVVLAAAMWLHRSGE